MRPRDEKIRNQKINYLVEQKFGQPRQDKSPTLKADFTRYKSSPRRVPNISESFLRTNNKKTSVKVEQQVKIQDVVNFLLSRRQDKKKYTIRELEEVIEKDVVKSITKELTDDTLEITAGKDFRYQEVQITTILGDALVTIDGNELIITIAEDILY